ncbi:MAG: hypothetical protein FJ109_19815 [Deltaproteobacteria bacterium]|nr:hypothetical protein [Deltaproteobacteria bacterium]
MTEARRQKHENTTVPTAADLGRVALGMLAELIVLHDSRSGAEDAAPWETTAMHECDKLFREVHRSVAALHKKRVAWSYLTGGIERFNDSLAFSWLVLAYQLEAQVGKRDSVDWGRISRGASQCMYWDESVGPADVLDDVKGWLARCTPPLIELHTPKSYARRYPAFAEALKENPRRRVPTTEEKADPGNRDKGVLEEALVRFAEHTGQSVRSIRTRLLGKQANKGKGKVSPSKWTPNPLRTAKAGGARGEQLCRVMEALQFPHDLKDYLHKVAIVELDRPT